MWSALGTFPWKYLDGLGTVSDDWHWFQGTMVALDSRLTGSLRILFKRAINGGAFPTSAIDWHRCHRENTTHIALSGDRASTSRLASVSLSRHSGALFQRRLQQLTC